MYRAAFRSTTRVAARSAQPSSAVAAGSRRLLSTTSANKPRTWKGAAARWGLAFAALYWYNTSPIFADDITPQTVPPPPQFSDADLPALESVIEQKRREAEEKAQKALRAAAPTPAPAASSEITAPEASVERQQKIDSAGPDAPASVSTPTATTAAEPSSPEALEEEASQQGAFDPETGEINWDCPCLGGMAHGPCGEEFKAAFSCFVYSKEEPKGMDCIDKFQHMQDCFRKYPEVYGAELADEDDSDDEKSSSAGAGSDVPVPAVQAQATERFESPETSQKPSAQSVSDEKKPEKKAGEAKPAVAKKGSSDSANASGVKS